MSFRFSSSRIAFLRKLRTTATTSASLTLLIACNFSDPNPPPNTLGANDPELESERFHEKSFSWDTQASKIPALAKTAARITRFETTEAFGEAIRELDAALQARAFSDSLWKPLDYACDELDLAIWNRYGTVHLSDSVVFSEDILKARCTYIGGSLNTLEKTTADYPSTESEHRVYPYKMIGRSWDNFDLVVYKSTGGETQFKKYREKLFTTAWWDTDATRIGVRIYLLNCGVTGTQRNCYAAGMQSDWYRNDDYVSKRDLSAGVQINYTPPSTITINPTKLRVSDAVYAMHSADHAGIAFRATSSSGLTPATTVIGMPTPEYVTW